MFTQEDLLALAISTAKRAHEGQVDKAGAPYFDHLGRVASRVWPLELKVVAYLHDILEDTDMTQAALLALGFPVYIVRAVESLTHRKNEPRCDYYKRIADYGSLAVAVKVADIEDNMDPTRLSQLDVATHDRLLRKYLDALAWLRHYESVRVV